MIEPLTAAAYQAKADRALASARILLANLDPDGACNRAYYAMFDAAYVALFKCGFGEEAVRTKTHHGIFLLFSREVVRPGKLPSELGRSLDRVGQSRLAADYLRGTPTSPDAAWTIECAEAFLAAVRALQPV